MQVLYKKNFYSMIKSCYARFYMRNMYLRSCYGNFIDTTKNIMLWEIMLWKDHVRRGLAVCNEYERRKFSVFICFYSRLDFS